MVVNGALGGQGWKEALKGGALSFAANAVHGTACNYIGGWRGDLGFIPHKIAHFMAGAVKGCILSEGDVEEMITGGAAGAFAETVAEFILPDAKTLRAEILAKSQADGKPLTGQALEDAVKARIQAVTNYSKIITTAAAVLLQRNPDMAFDVASGALENNFISHAIESYFNKKLEEDPESETLQKMKKAADKHSKALEFIGWTLDCFTPIAIGKPRESPLTAENLSHAYNTVNFEIPALARAHADLLDQQARVDAVRGQYKGYGYGMGMNPSGGEGAVLSALFPTRALDLVGSCFSFARKAAVSGVSQFSKAFQFVSKGSNLSKPARAESTMANALDLAMGNQASRMSILKPQIRINYETGRAFQNDVHDFLRIPENQTIYSVLLPGKGKVGTKPDLPLLTAGVTDIKNVKYITFTKQLRAQAALAHDKMTSFNLIISPWTEMISKNLGQKIYRSGGKIFEYNPATEKMVERTLNGNKIVRK